MHEKSWVKGPVVESNKHSHVRRSLCLSRQEQTTHFMMQIPSNLISASDMERPNTGSRTGATTLQLLHLGPRTKHAVHLFIHSLRQILAPGCLPLFTTESSPGFPPVDEPNVLL